MSRLRDFTRSCHKTSYRLVNRGPGSTVDCYMNQHTRVEQCLWVVSTQEAEYGLYLITAWWRHHMETFFALLALCEGNPPVTGGFPSQRPVTRSFDFSLICVWTNGSANNRDAGDLRRNRPHFDVIVVWFPKSDKLWQRASCYTKIRDSSQNIL